MALKEEIIGFQYQVIKKMYPDKEIYLVKDNLSGQLLIKKEVEQSKVGIYQKLAGIPSVHLPHIFDIAEQEGRCFVYEEFLQGMTLDEILQQSSLPKKLALSYATQLCDALLVLHNQQMIHRDIQPRNIIITNDGIVKVVDFGNARVYAKGKVRDTVLMGTAGYAAPEQFGIEQTDCTTDIYAIGVLLNKMLTGCFPNELLYEDSRMIKHIIMKCTELDKGRRYDNVLALKQDLQKGEKGYRLRRIVQEIPGFRPRDKHPWVIRLLVYPFMYFYWAEITRGIESMMKLNTVQNVLWYVGAMFFSTVFPFVLLSNMWNIEIHVLHLQKYSKGARIAIRCALAYVSVMMLGVMLAIHFAS